MDTAIHCSGVNEDLLRADVKVEIKQEEIKEIECLFLPINQAEDCLTGVNILNAPIIESCLEEDPLSTDVKIEIKEEEENKELDCLLLPVNQTEECIKSTCASCFSLVVCSLIYYTLSIADFSNNGGVLTFSDHVALELVMYGVSFKTLLQNHFIWHLKSVICFLYSQRNQFYYTI
ncbi:uncharacterized protein LOC142317305 isoform X1 [Lycorma delicatula]|uniref:uncharacterized protein LOC142317305 isoform X1 n=1 Tax=Lycorma delicatula TaxID=130591 RepID=UPI003F50F4B2